jgi:superoxide reductase
MSVKFYVCERCGNIVEKIKDSGVTPHCCGQKMTELVAGTVEASREKHIPVVNVGENSVEVIVGSVIHPMSEEHNISWIYLETDKGGYRRDLAPSDEPRAVFALNGEKPLSVYAYCNLHGLWKTEI